MKVPSLLGSNSTTQAGAGKVAYDANDIIFVRPRFTSVGGTVFNESKNKLVALIYFTLKLQIQAIKFRALEPLKMFLLFVLVPLMF